MSDQNFPLNFSAVHQWHDDFSSLQIFLIYISLDDSQYITLAPRSSLRFSVKKVEHEYLIEDNDLKVFALGQSLDELLHSVVDSIRFLWTHYVMEDDQNLTDGAIVLANKIRNTFQEIHHDMNPLL